MLSNLLKLEGSTPLSTSPTTLTSVEFKEELQKVLDAISYASNLANSTDIDEALKAEFREFLEREMQRFN